jgi:hypothetical protein
VCGWAQRVLRVLRLFRLFRLLRLLKLKQYVLQIEEQYDFNMRCVHANPIDLVPIDERL